jgi:subtilisin-like proprotein convertase family protein
MNNLIGAWNFDGNLLNYGSTSSINGSFNTGGTNNCRMSGYLNEYTPGAPSSVFTAYPTVLNRSASGNPFPGGFAVKSPDKPITDLQTTRDTITFSGNGNVTSVEVYISIAHTYPDDLDITLRAPNGTTRNLSSDNGGSNQSGIVTFFVDGESPITGTTLFPPYSNLIGPEAVMGSFGSSLVAGNWILEVYDDNTGAAGTLRGWGIRMNGALTTIELVSNNTPDRYSLSQNYPNPFNPNTKIEFRISKLGFTKLVVFDVTGREVSILVNDVLKQGTYEVDFDGSNFASGVYYYILIAGDYTETRKMMLVK